jgi:hypothetical protein
MSNWTLILPLVGVVVGWVLNEFSHVFRLRREERRAIGRVLSDLIGIRRHLLAVKVMAEQIGKHGNFSAQEQVYFQWIIDSFMPELEDFHNKYQESVKIVSGIRPVLGFWLGLQDQSRPVIRRIREVMAINEQASTKWLELSPHLTDTESLDGIIVKLARLHGWRTLYNVKNHLKEPLRELPFDLERLLKEEAANKSEQGPSVEQKAPPQN